MSSRVRSNGYIRTNCITRENKKTIGKRGRGKRKSKREAMSGGDEKGERQKENKFDDKGGEVAERE